MTTTTFSECWLCGDRTATYSVFNRYLCVDCLRTHTPGAYARLAGGYEPPRLTTYGNYDELTGQLRAIVEAA